MIESELQSSEPQNVFKGSREVDLVDSLKHHFPGMDIVKLKNNSIKISNGSFQRIILKRKKGSLDAHVAHPYIIVGLMAVTYLLYTRVFEVFEHMIVSGIFIVLAIIFIVYEIKSIQLRNKFRSFLSL